MIKLPKEAIEKIKNDIIAEIEDAFEKKKLRLDNIESSDIDQIVNKIKNDIGDVNIDTDKIIAGLLGNIIKTEEEKQIEFNRQKILDEETRAELIEAIIQNIELPKDGEKGERGDQGEKGEPGKDADQIVLSEKDKKEIAEFVDITKLIKDRKQDIVKLIEALKSGKIKIRSAGLDIKEIVTGINKTVNEGTQLLNYLYEEKTEGDEGINCTGEFHVGQPGAGRETALGEGDSHTKGMVVLATPDGVTFVDNTVEAASASGSEWDGTAGGTGINAAAYIGSDSFVCGFKLTTTTLVDPGPTGAVTREYWNGSGWAPFTAMATNANPPYEQRADNIGAFIGEEQVRISFCDDQQKTVVNGFNKYWIRFRVTSPIAASGFNQQIKLHTNRLEVNADGFTEYFGDGIYPQDLLMQWGLTEVLTGFSPLNQTIDFASGISLSYTSNRLNNGQTSGRGGFVIIPEGLDTSRGVQFEIAFTPLDNTAGNVLFNLDTYQASIGDTLTTANIPVVTPSESTILINSEDVLIKNTILVDVQNLFPGEFLAFGLKRLGATDTYSGAIAIVNIRAIGYFWKP